MASGRACEGRTEPTRVGPGRPSASADETTTSSQPGRGGGVGAGAGRSGAVRGGAGRCGAARAGTDAGARARAARRAGRRRWASEAGLRAAGCGQGGRGRGPAVPAPPRPPGRCGRPAPRTPGLRSPACRPPRLRWSRAEGVLAALLGGAGPSWGRERERPECRRKRGTLARMSRRLQRRQAETMDVLKFLLVCIWILNRS